MGLKNRFAMDDPYLLTQQIQTSNNNQATLNTALAEADHLRGSSVVYSSQAVNIHSTTPCPTPIAAAQSTVGAALGGIGQADTFSVEPGGGGNPVLHDEYPEERLA